MRPSGRNFVIAALLLYSFFSAAEAAAEKLIGILMYSEEVRYVEARKGFTDRLKEAGYAQPDTRFIVKDADGNKARAAELVKEFSAGKMDLILTLGTSMTVPVAREIKNIPIVFGVVYNPVAAGIAKDWKSSGNNVTGATTMIPMSRLLNILVEIKHIRRLAVLYTPSENNSVMQVKDLREAAANYKIKIIPVPFTKKEEISQMLPEVLRTSDALYITGSNLVDSRISMIVEMATKANVVTITHLDDLVAKGVLLGVCSDSYRNGRLAGEKAVRIFNGENPSSISMESPQDYNVVINMETARKGQFRIPEGIVKKATVSPRNHR